VSQGKRLNAYTVYYVSSIKVKKKVKYITTFNTDLQEKQHTVEWVLEKQVRLSPLTFPFMVICGCRYLLTISHYAASSFKIGLIQTRIDHGT
jgi:hypothetical protein